MERYGAVLFLQIVVLALSFQAGLGIKCYLCNSNMNPKCGDPINRTALEPKECSLNLYQEASETLAEVGASFKNAMSLDIPQGQIGANTKFACQKVDIRDESGNHLIMRGCTLAKSETGGDTCEMKDGVEKLTGGQGKVHFCQTCEDDLCNSSNRPLFTSLFFMLVPCFAIILSVLTQWVHI